ncbi:terminase gpA endonuclease subunit, partial [Vibrio cyclitrophicus]|uniref:terminase gpA endonuclease subunit n=1 Tax=Vibrio cyclitrophicus TaxID=47951 RepID=UPI0035317E3E
DSSIAPYMRKPLERAFSRQCRELGLVGSARSTKTKTLLDGVVFYRVWQNPCDILLIFATQKTAHGYSDKELGRMVRNTEPLQKLQTGNRHDDGIERKRFRNDSTVTINSATNDALSAQGYGVVIFTDYDRAEDDGNGAGGNEGDKFGRGSKRTLQAGSDGITIAEASPSRTPIKDQEGLKPHQAPRATGITAIYNDGTCEVWYWPCPHCDKWFMAKWECLQWEDGKPDTAKVVCPCCGESIYPDEKHDINLAGDYMFPGEVDENGIRQVIEQPDLYRSSFWFEGLCAAFNDWGDMVKEYIVAVEHYEKFGDESKLQVFFNTTVGRPYTPIAVDSELTGENLQDRATNYQLPQGVAPADTRFLFATIDVQGGANSRFDVQVTAFSEHCQWQPIDRFQILLNEQRMEAGEPQRVQPHVYVDDWLPIIDKVINKEYAIDGTDLTIVPRLTLCDSGGSDNENGEGNTTFHAYQFYRELQKKGLENRFLLLKGNPRAFREKEWDGWTKISEPDSSSDHPMAARGDIPLLNINSNVVKSSVYSSMMNEQSDSPRYFRPPFWAKQDWYNGLLSEEKNDKGQWHCPKGKNNEPFDHAQYAFAGLWHTRAMAIDWGKPPNWAAPLNINVNVSRRGEHTTASQPRKRKRVISRGLT